MAVDVFGIDANRLFILRAGDITGTEGHLFQQTLKQRVQATGTDVLGFLVHLPGDFRQALDAFRHELDVQAFGFQQLAVLLGQRCVRLAEDAFEILWRQRLELDADWQTALQLRHQIARLAQVECTGRNKQDVVGLDHAQLGIDCATFDQRQQVALHAFAGHIGTADITALGHLVDFVDKHDAVLLNGFQGLGLEFFVVDQAAGFFVTHHFQGFFDFQLAALALAFAHVGKQALQLVGHFFHAWRRGDVDAHGIGHFDFNFLVVQLAFAQTLAEQLASVGVLRYGRFFAERAGRWQQGVEDALFSGVFGAVANLDDFLLTQQLDGSVSQIADDRFNVAAYIANFGELGRFNLDKRRVGQLGQATGDFGFTDTGRADHQDVFWRDFNAQFFGQLHPAPAVAQRDGYGALGVVLADDVAIEFVDNFAGSHGHDNWRSSS